MDQFIGIFKSLADKTRLKILNLLLTNDLCVGSLAKNLNLSEAAVSQHLQILRKAGIVKGEKRGYYTHYSININILKDASLEINKIISLAQQWKNISNTEISNNDQTCLEKEKNKENK